VNVTRPLRADAARNAERLMCEARLAFAEPDGADVPLEDIARRAGLGVATLYRRFANKDELIRAILERRYAESVEPVIREAVTSDDPWQAMVDALGAAMQLAEDEYGTIKASRDHNATIGALAGRFFDDLGQLMLRAQDRGLVRPDVTPDDIPVLVVMLFNAMHVTGPNGWRHYLTVLLDGLRPAAVAAKAADRKS
jgi:AcrR family transcriptional regulator